MNKPAEQWGGGAAYETYMGRWSSLIAPVFAEWLGVASGSKWLDVGCGTGVLSSAIIAAAQPASVKGLDPSEGFVRFARQEVRDERASFSTGDAEDLPEESASYDAVVSGLVLNFVGDPSTAIAEFRRVARPGGTVAAYVWDYADKMELTRYFWDAAAAVDASGAGLDEGARFPICHPEPLRASFAGAGLDTVDVRSIDAFSVFPSFDDYWSPFLGQQGAAPAYLAGLSEDARARVRARLQDIIPVQPDGHIRLMLRAWAVKGRRPAD